MLGFDLIEKFLHNSFIYSTLSLYTSLYISFFTLALRSDTGSSCSDGATQRLVNMLSLTL
jgi:hypothetical protein